ncbi:carboxymuconolactone decarboxylase family protein [Streptomyces sp. NPDC058665]|uniref:carboxymuconolactone decarboxylase family protein n=1 Tax=Streptomyces sp. NPDC058665 TaxID=3346586 RepID=UPI003646EAF2
MAPPHHSPRRSTTSNPTDHIAQELPCAVQQPTAASSGRYETYAHVVFARSAGLSETTIRSLLAGNTDALEDVHELTHRFTTELLTAHRVSDATYDQALHAFGRDGVLDLVHLVAMYVEQAVMLNAFDTPAPRVDLQT